MHCEESFWVEAVGGHVVLIFPNFLQLLLASWVVHLEMKKMGHV